jgi:hypothetical protein
MQDLKALAVQVENLSMAVNQYNDFVHQLNAKKAVNPEDEKTLTQMIEMIMCLSDAINSELLTLADFHNHLLESPRIEPEKVEADQNFKGALEVSLEGWKSELNLIQKEQIDQAIIDAKEGARSNRYIALEKREKDLLSMINDANEKLGTVSERVVNAAFSNQVSSIVNAAKP